MGPASGRALSDFPGGLPSLLPTPGNSKSMSGSNMLEFIQNQTQKSYRDGSP